MAAADPDGPIAWVVVSPDLDWLRDLGGTVLRETGGAAVVEDPEGNRALLVQRPPGDWGRHPWVSRPGR
jgi:hypothetical protein